MRSAPTIPRYILAFHRISWERYSQLVSAALAGRHPCTLEGCSSCGQPGAGPGVAITFDDGVADAVEVGAEGARRFGWPAVFYLPTDFLDGEPLWQEVLTAVVRHAPAGTYSLFGRRFTLPHDGDREAIKVALIERLRGTPGHDMGRLMTQLRETLDPGGTAPLDHSLPRPATWQRIEELARLPLLQFGSHTVTHRPLAVLDPAEIEVEMVRSMSRISDVLGRPTLHFCYPFGHAIEIGDEARRIARRYFRTAVTLHQATVRPETDRAWMPRIDLYEHDRPWRLAAKLLRARFRRAEG